MRRYGPGEVVPAGYYLRNGTWELVSLPAGGVLPHGEDIVYYRVPLVVVLVGGPLTGLVWLFVYPLIIPLFICYVALRKVREALSWALRGVSDRFANPYSHSGGSRR